MAQAEDYATFVVGALNRRAFRRMAMSKGLSFSEDRGWLDSFFVVRGNGFRLNELQQWVQRVRT